MDKDTCTYHFRGKNELKCTHLQVMVLLLADTLNTIFEFVYLYTALIIHFGMEFLRLSIIRRP